MKHPVLINIIPDLIESARNEKTLGLGEATRPKIKNLKVSEGSVITAEAEGSKGEIYNVRIDCENRRRKCSCPAHKHYAGACKHVLACALIVEEVLSLLN